MIPNIHIERGYESAGRTVECYGNNISQTATFAHNCDF